MGFPEEGGNEPFCRGSDINASSYLKSATLEGQEKKGLPKKYLERDGLPCLSGVCACRD